MSFHGSYRATDVEFLLTPMTRFVTTSVAEKEGLIQSGQRHYSELLSPESIPSPAYRELFRLAHSRNRQRMAADCLKLAFILLERKGPRVTLVSLARAGTPIGAILAGIIGSVSGVRPDHYSVSIIRDRGIDTVAIDHILGAGHAPESLAFIDGWTGKGVISNELAVAVDQYNTMHGVSIDGGLYVLSDLAGTASCAASGEDYLIPSSILNATISGLVSRSILDGSLAKGSFHGCVYYDRFAAYDLSTWFVDEMCTLALEIHARSGDPRAEAADTRELRRASLLFIQEEMTRSAIGDPNLIKPGIGEATRVLLRRQARRVVVRDLSADCVAHLLLLAAEKGVPVEERTSLPYHAVSLIGAIEDA